MKLTDFSVKAVKIFKGHDGNGYNCNLYLNNKKVAEIIEDGWGGGLQIHWKDSSAPKVEINRREDATKYCQYKGTPTEKVLVELLNDHPPCEDFDTPLYYNIDMFVDDLVNDHLEAKEFKRKCKTKTLIITKECQKGQYIAYSRAYSPQMKDFIKKEHGSNLVKIINEDYL